MTRKTFARKRAISILASFAQDHLTAGDFWNDIEYQDIVKALKVLYPTKRLNNKGEVNLFSIACLVYLGFMAVVLLTIF